MRSRLNFIYESGVTAKTKLSRWVQEVKTDKSSKLVAIKYLSKCLYTVTEKLTLQNTEHKHDYVLWKTFNDVHLSLNEHFERPKIITLINLIYAVSVVSFSFGKYYMKS